MPSFMARLYLDDKTINILDADIHFFQSCHPNGWPGSRPNGGLFSLMIESADAHDELVAWAVSPVMMKQGVVRYFKPDSMSRRFDLEFWDAYCVGYYEHFNHAGPHPMVTRLVISPGILRIKDVVFQKPWKVSDINALPAQPASGPPLVTSPYLFYHRNGAWLCGSGHNVNVYITDAPLQPGDEKTRQAWDALKDSSIPLSATHADLLKLAGIAHGEAGHRPTLPPAVQKEELFAIASAALNGIRREGMTIATIRNTFSYAIGKAAYNSLVNATGPQRNGRLRHRHAVAAAINALLGGPDRSNGATQWDGTDVLLGLYDPVYRRFSNPGLHFRQRRTLKGTQGIYDPNGIAAQFMQNVRLYYSGWPAAQARLEEVKGLKVYPVKFAAAKPPPPFPEAAGNPAIIAAPQPAATRRERPAWEVTACAGATIFYKEL